jgi:aryl-alcohol dehydrogenase-like predicted oxidoreductase
VKFGAQRDPAGAFLGADARPAAVKTALAYTLQRLGVDHIDIYRPGRLDPEDTIGAIADMVQAGYVWHIALSEVGPKSLRRAAAVHPIVDLQIEYSLLSRDIEDEILPTCRELGIGITAYGVLARGLLGGHLPADGQYAPGDFRGHFPRFQGENFAANLKLVEALRAVASKLDATPAQVAVGWMFGQGPDIVPVVGARTQTRLAEAIGATGLKLSHADLSEIERAVPKGAAAGERHPPSIAAVRRAE